jgi:hypothetical protein
MKAIVTDCPRDKKMATNIEMEADNRDDLVKWLISMSKRNIESDGYIVGDEAKFCYGAWDIQGTGNIDTRTYIEKAFIEHKTGNMDVWAYIKKAFPFKEK